MRIRYQTAAVLIVGLSMGLLASGCFDRELKPLDPCLISGVVEKVKATNIDKIDLLFMVDNSGSMTEEQAALAAEIPRLVEVLASGDVGNDGEREFTPVNSLRVGVISSDFGNGGIDVYDQNCNTPGFPYGDDGLLLDNGCAGVTQPAFIDFSPDGGDPAAFGAQIGCLANLGTSGCGFEMQLESLLKALTPSDSAIRFGVNGDLTGHGPPAGANSFQRDDSLLAVILVTDEDDCSTTDYGIFEEGGGAADINLRCEIYKDVLFGIDRYVQGLLALRADPQLFVYAAITGVPRDLVDPYGSACEGNTECGPGGACVNGTCEHDFDAILADTRMVQQEDLPDVPGRFRPACGSADSTGLAYPAKRITEVARGLDAAGSNAVLTSICNESFASAIDAIIRKLADVLGGSCLPRALNRDGAGLVPCDVIEILPVPDPTKDLVTQCSEIPGRELIRTEEGSEVCKVTQVLDASGGAGWYYDDSSQDVQSSCGVGGRRIAFTVGNQPRAGTTVRLECLQPVQSTEITIGTPCDSEADCGPNNTQGKTPKYEGMICESESNTCQVPCENDADCRAQGLGPHVCDNREGQAQICVNPTCQL